MNGKKCEEYLALLGAASVITRVSDTVTVSDPKGTSTKLGSGMLHCAEKGRAAGPGGKQAQWNKTALHVRKVGLILLLKGLIENPKALNECKSSV